MAKLIRELMGRKPHPGKLKGTVEIDETYIGGPRETKVGRSNIDKTAVFAMVERRGNVIAMKVDDVKKLTLFPIIEDNIDKTAKVMSDEYKTYVNLADLGYIHKTIRHQLKRYTDGEISTNTIEGFFSQLKRMIRGTHLHISKKYVQQYVDECVFRYNHRFTPEKMFDDMLNAIVA